MLFAFKIFFFFNFCNKIAQNKKDLILVDIFDCISSLKRNILSTKYTFCPCLGIKFAFKVTLSKVNIWSVRVSFVQES